MKHYITEEEFKNSPYIMTMVAEADGDYHCEFFVLSKKEEPIDSPDYLNVVGSYVYGQHDGKCFLSTPSLNFSENFYPQHGLCFHDKHFYIAYEAMNSFQEFAQKVTTYMRTEITKEAIDNLD